MADKDGPDISQLAKKLAEKFLFVSEIDVERFIKEDADTDTTDILGKIFNFSEEISKLDNAYGILRVDYPYIPSRGDPGSRDSFKGRKMEALYAEGWTFKTAQNGMDKDDPNST